MNDRENPTARQGNLIADLYAAQDRRPAHLGPLDPATLTPFQRGLLAIVGLVTQFIEAYKLEPVVVRTLSQEAITLPDADAWMELAEGAEVVSRRVLLMGEHSSTPYVYGEARVAEERLDKTVGQDLYNSPLGVGRILRLRRMEAFGELLWFGAEEMGEMPEVLRDFADRPVISRTYRFVSAGKPVILITERFPLEEMKVR